MTRRPAAILAALTLAAGVAGCTPTADPAVTAALAYYQSVDAGTPEQCSMDWAYRLDPAKVVDCEKTSTEPVNALVGQPVVKRNVEMPVPPGGTAARALVLAVTLKNGAMLDAVAMVQDDSGKWYFVKSESLPREPSSDAELIGVLA